jgi:pilus assembly protein CpaF
MQDLYLFEKKGLGPSGRVKGRFISTGIVPKFSERLLAAGVQSAATVDEEIVEV